MRHTHEDLLKEDVKESFPYSNRLSAIGHSIQPLNREPISRFPQNLTDRYWFLKLVETSIGNLLPITETGGDGLIGDSNRVGNNGPISNQYFFPDSRDRWRRPY